MPPTAAALADLTEISTQIETAVVFDREGTVLESTVDGSALGLLKAAEDARPEGAEPLVQLDVALRDGSVFVVADEDRVIAATTAPGPTVGLVFYDLKSCLRGLAEESKPKPRRRAAPAKKPTTRTRAKKDDAKS
jgi:hypothetical protein